MRYRPLGDKHLKDREDTWTEFSEQAMIETYREIADPRVPCLYHTHLPLAIFREELWEEVQNQPAAYDWTEYSRDGVYPPIKVLVGAWNRPPIFVKDGNHRIRKWREFGFLLAPAWVLDYSSST
jgi:hypothetical protein